MPGFGPDTSPRAIGRAALAAATVASALIGFGGDARWFGASGAFGTAWWAWDFLWDNVIGPLGAWFTGMITGVADVEEPPDLTVDDTIRLLEGHLTSDGVTRHVQIQSAIRLSELYRLTKKDPDKAREVIQRAQARWPDAPELKMFEKGLPT
jgi:hypothetical protein